MESAVKPNASFEEIEHTADWELRVWAPRLESLLEQSGRGMYSLAGIFLQAAPRIKRHFSLSAADAESLLVLFLSELLYYGEEERIAFDEFQLDIQQGFQLEATLYGSFIEQQYKEIKAVTYHKLAVRQTHSGLEVNIVFDV
jgi:SHS2 domain-containing protein